MSKDAITLILPQHVLIAGQSFQGEVELDFNALQQDEIQEVHVKLRGAVETRLARQNQQQRMTEHERRELVRQDISLWQKGSVYPPPGSHILRFPFHFVLPSNLPPSSHHEAVRGSGVIAYMVEAVGVRDGTFTRNRRVAQSISIIPPDPTGAQIRQLIQSGWQGRWQAVQEQDDIRRGLWGGYAKVSVQLSFPAIDVFPLFTEIPFSLQVITNTKEMNLDETPDDPSEPIFPSPPTHPHHIEFLLRSQTRVSSRLRSSETELDVVALGRMGKGDKTGGTSGVEVVVSERVWVPSQKEDRKGSWRQQVDMRSTIHLRCTPSFNYSIMSVDYFFHLKVPFPGIGNSLRIDMPVVIGSGCLIPTPPQLDTGYAPAYVQPIPQLDLPPAYWSHTEWADDKN